MRIAIACLSALIPMAMWAQANVSPESADKAYTAQNWTEAESQYAELTKRQPENARFWYRLGVSARGNQHYDMALEAMQKAKTLGAGKGLPPSLADYEIATIYAGMGDSAKALLALKSSADGGFFQPGRLKSDAEWNTLRGNEQFVVLAKEVQHNATPCEDPEFKQFDFWIGDWAVASSANAGSAVPINTERSAKHPIIRFAILQSPPWTRPTFPWLALEARHSFPVAAS